MTSSLGSAAGRLGRRRRQLELAGDRRAGGWARRRARTAQRRYVRAHCRLLAAAALALLAPVLLAALLVPSTQVRYFLLGADLAGTTGVLAVWVLQVTGTGPAMMGDLAEQWTAAELRGLRRGGWRLVNQLALRPWDIDHVLIGSGGAVVVETKWSANPWVLDPPDERVRRAVRQAQGNARDLRLWGRSRAQGFAQVLPVVMLWGPGSSQLDLIHLDGVAVVPGPSAKAWRDSLPCRVLTAEQIQDAWSTLELHARARDSAAEPIPPSVQQLAGTAAVTAAAAAAGFVAAAWLLALLASLYAWAPLCACLAALAHPLRRYKIGRLPALGWQTGLLTTVGLAGVPLLLR